MNFAQKFILINSPVKISSLKNLYLVNSLIFSLWWIVLNPGFYSSDSIAVLERVANRRLSSEFTYLWDVFVFVVTFGGNFPHLATLASGIILVTSFTFFCCSFFDRRTSFLASIFVSNLPIVFGLGLTLWHDVLMTSGLLLFVSAMKRSCEVNLIRNSIYAAAFVLVNTRLNGFWTLLFSLITLFCLKQINLRNFIKLSIFLVFITAPFAYLNSIKSISENAQVSGITHWMKYDIACYLSATEESRDDIRSKVLDYELVPATLTSSNACRWFMEPRVLSSWSLVPTEKIVKIWVELLQRDSTSIFEIHANRSEYLVFNPLRIPAKPPFLHTTIEYENPWVQELNPRIYELARNYPRAWNALRPITAYAGLWWFLIFINSLRNVRYLPILIVSSVLNVSIFITAIIPDTRYVAFTLIAGMALSVAELWKFFLKNRK